MPGGFPCILLIKKTPPPPFSSPSPRPATAAAARANGTLYLPRRGPALAGGCREEEEAAGGQARFSAAVAAGGMAAPPRPLLPWRAGRERLSWLSDERAGAGACLPPLAEPGGRCPPPHSSPRGRGSFTARFSSVPRGRFVGSGGLPSCFAASAGRYFLYLFCGRAKALVAPVPSRSHLLEQCVSRFLLFPGYEEEKVPFWGPFLHAGSVYW